MTNYTSMSGYQALGSIDQALAELQQQIQASDQQNQVFSDQVIELGQEQSKNFRELARFRLDHVLNGALQAELDSTDQRVKYVLEKRRISLTQLEKDMLAAGQAQAGVEQERSILADELVQKITHLEKLEAQAQQQLSQQAAYQLQLEKAQLAEQIADQAERKVMDAQQDRIDKGETYEQDPLFSYLWARGYGTSQYHANALIRFLDRRVADLCAYHDARPNYAMLLEIPLRLEEHAAQLRAIANQEGDLLDEMELQAATDVGLPAFQNSLDGVRQRIDQSDLHIAQMEDAMHEMQARKLVFVSGEDPQFSQAVQILAETLELENLDALYQRARATPNRQDDMLVDDLYENDQALEQLRNKLSELKSRHAEHLHRLAELEKVRRNFKQARYDEPRSGFGNKAMLLMMLNEFIKGMVGSDDVWDTIRREQRSRPTKNSQSPGRASPWGGSWDRSRSRQAQNQRGPWAGGLGGRPGRSQPGGRSGGFKTGGGF